MVCRVITESAYIVSQASAQGAVELYIYICYSESAEGGISTDIFSVYQALCVQDPR